jgi:ElaB/YqjD/DUF883 family membrane-anchored ribosome-binding protein
MSMSNENVGEKVTSARTAQTADALERDVAQLREDLKRLRDDMLSLAGAATDDARQKARQKLSDAEETLHNVVDTGASELAEIQRQAEKAVRKNPLSAVGAALALGYFFSTLTRK